MKQGTLVGVVLSGLAFASWYLLIPGEQEAYPPAKRSASSQTKKQTKPKAKPVAKPAVLPVAAKGIRELRAEQMEACEDCHPTIVEGFQKTGMGRSLYRTADAEKIEDFTTAKTIVRHEASGLTYRAYVDAEGRWWQEEVHPASAFSRRVEALYVIGSGNHTRSYLGEVNGRLIELPLTWYVRKKIWDMSPGYIENNFRFTRDVRPKCIFCHNDLTPTRPGTVSGYSEPLALGISCARCHGDPTEHIALRQAGNGPAKGERDTSILNPKHLPKPLSEQVCEQCHLQGKSRVLVGGQKWDAYSPEKPLQDYMSIYVEKGEAGPEFGIASHGYRLKLSACAQDETLQCTTCHNPHQKNTTEAYLAACKKCHNDTKDARSTSCQNSKGRKHGSDCVKCHMYKGETSDIPHVNFSDHYIRRRPEELLNKPNTKVETTALVDVYSERRTDDEGEAARLGYAHHDVVENRASSMPEEHAKAAIAILEYTLENNPEDGRALKTVGDLYVRDESYQEAADRLSRAVKVDGSNALVWRQLADVYIKLNEPNQAEEALLKATKLRPDFIEAWVDLGNVRHRLRRFNEAERAYQRAEKLDPELAITPFNQALNFMAMNQFRRAKALFSEAIRRDPMNLRPYLRLGLLQFETRNAEDSIQLMGRALKIDPNHSPALWLRGRARLETRDLKGARADFVKFMKLEPTHMMAYINLAQVEHAMENYEGGRFIIQKGIERLGPHPNFNKALEELKKSSNPLYDLPQ